MGSNSVNMGNAIKEQILSPTLQIEDYSRYAEKNYSIADLEFEISQIPDLVIKDWTRTALLMVPDKFWTEPASKTGRFHPKDESLRGGTVRHTKRAFVAMAVLCDSEADRLSKTDISYLLSAILLHDTCKGSKGTPHAEAVYPTLSEKLGNTFVERYPEIMKSIETHMGRWGKKRPTTNLELLVHYADDMASMAHLLMQAGFENVKVEIND
jgi:hypothetical protein